MGFITHLKIEFLLPFASCKKLVGKMLALVDNQLRFFNHFLLLILLIMVYLPISNGVIEPSPKLFSRGNNGAGASVARLSLMFANVALTVYLCTFYCIFHGLC